MKYWLTIVSFYLITTHFAQAQQNELMNYLSMDGDRMVHTIQDSIDTLSDHKIIELQDSAKTSVCFARQFYKTVCYSGVCKMVRIWIIWDGVGNYRGYQLNEGEVLTKTDHTEFTHQDYLKLHEVLKDSTSVLKNLKQEELVIPSEKESENTDVDGYSGATKPALNEVVIKGAVYTCHTLWHTVYGTTQKEIISIIENRIDADYLSRLLNSGNEKYEIWAIRFIASHRKYQDTFDQKIVDKTDSDFPEVAMVALSYFHSDKLFQTNIQEALVSKMPNWKASQKNDLLWWLYEVKNTHKIQDYIILKLLELYNYKDISVASLNLIYQLIEKDQLINNPKLVAEINKIKNSDDRYVNNLTKKFLEKINL